MSAEEAARVDEVYTKFVENKVAFSGMININKHKDGHEVVIESNGVPILSDDGELLGYRGIDRDITERKKVEEELLIAKEKAEESDKLKTEFINNMSHEIRTPMNGIIGFTKFLDRSGLSNEKRSTYIKIIQNSGKQLLQIIDDILEISKLETKQVKVINEKICLNDFLFEMFSIFDIKAKENKTPLYLKNGLQDSQSYIITDKTKLNKVLSNLLENSLKYTNNGAIEFGYQLINDGVTQEIELFVQDTGIGIELDKQQLVFERFSRANSKLSKKARGLGLGLSIAKENAELIGGEIKLVSEPNKGTTFFLTIPYQAEIQKNKSKSKKGSSESFTVLIAEDEEVNYLLLEELMHSYKKNINCKHAKHGKEALEILQNHSNIRLVLMDLKMPVMNGFDAAVLIKKTHPKLKIIAQTAYSTKEDMNKAMNAGCDYFLSKPVDEIQLFKILDDVLEKSIIN